MWILLLELKSKVLNKDQKILLSNTGLGSHRCNSFRCSPKLSGEAVFMYRKAHRSLDQTSDCVVSLTEVAKWGLFLIIPCFSNLNC